MKAFSQPSPQSMTGDTTLQLVEDVRNMSRKVIKNIRNNMFDQDALENLLHHESKENKGFMLYLRNYTTSEGGKDSKVLRFVSETLVSFLIEPACHHVKHIEWNMLCAMNNHTLHEYIKTKTNDATGQYQVSIQSHDTLTIEMLSGKLG